MLPEEGRGLTPAIGKEEGKKERRSVIETTHGTSASSHAQAHTALSTPRSEPTTDVDTVHRTADRDLTFSNVPLGTTQWHALESDATAEVGLHLKGKPDKLTIVPRFTWPSRPPAARRPQNRPACVPTHEIWGGGREKEV
jgi:hypothetical protein